jgi:hypothetical protein
VDDDDAIAADYVARLLRCIDSKPDAHCVGITVMYTPVGGEPQPIDCSVAQKSWTPGVADRPPIQLNPIRADLARRIRWDGGYGADQSWARRMARAGLLTDEVHAGPEPVYWYRDGGVDGSH